MAKKNSKKTVPELRFRGFTDPWEQRQLGEVAEFSKGQGYSKADLCSSGIPAFLYGQMYTDYKLLVTESGQYLPQNSDGVFSTAGDVIIPASGESPEEIAIASVIGKSGILLGGDLNIIKPEKSILDSIFLALSASGGRLHGSLVSRAQGKTIVHLHNSDIAASQIRFPTLPEQHRIGDFFSAFDSLIAAAERQEALLRQKKQAYLQLMFPQEGETEPRLRFAGFSGEWQRRKLRELVSEGSIALKRGEVIPRQTGKYPVYSSSASEDGLFCTSDSFMFDQELVTWSIDGGGKPFYRQHHRFSVTNVCGYALIRNPQTLTYRFLGLAMGRAWARAHFDYSSKAHPSVIEKIYILPIPSLPEQRCIGAFFSTLDNLIAATEKRTKSLHTLKSAYLQRMFV